MQMKIIVAFKSHYTAVSKKIAPQNETMPKGFMGDWGSSSLMEALGVSATYRENSTNKRIDLSLFSSWLTLGTSINQH